MYCRWREEPRHLTELLIATREVCPKVIVIGRYAVGVEIITSAPSVVFIPIELMRLRHFPRISCMSRSRVGKIVGHHREATLFTVCFVHLGCLACDAHLAYLIQLQVPLPRISLCNYLV